MKNTIKKETNLTGIEYAGLESLFQRIVETYEEECLGIPHEDQTPVSQIIRRTASGIEVFDGAYDLYLLGGFAVRSLYVMDGHCIMAGFHTQGMDAEECFDREGDILLDLTEFLDESYIDLEWLFNKIRNAQ